MDFRYLTNVAVVTVLLLIVPASVYSDSETSEISVVKSEAVKISDVDDWDFGVSGPLAVTDSALRLRDNTCVFSSTGLYSLQVTSQNGGNRLRMVTSGGDRLRYTIRLRYRDGNSFSNRRLRNSNMTLTGLSASQTPDCSDQGNRNWNLRFIPTVGRNAFNRASPGIYTDLITLVIVPE